VPLALVGRSLAAAANLKRHAQNAQRSAAIASHSSRFHSSGPASGTSCVLRSAIVQYSVNRLTARLPIGSISAASVRLSRSRTSFCESSQPIITSTLPT